MPRFRFDREAGSLGAGVGLGLAISKALVDRMGGSIEIRSEGIGKGTVAVVSLAVAPNDRPMPRENDSASLVSYS